ncbi:MAG TPA: hypothetical protein VLA58_08700, partial [Chitinophagaceae bacterium]|nr:hypothetical protein [Chitinophagaceae bacterium]
MTYIKPSSLFCSLILTCSLFAQTEKIDLAVMAKIRNEGLQNSKVMDIAFQITEKSGPRVTNSSGFTRAA